MAKAIPEPVSASKESENDTRPSFRNSDMSPVIIEVGAEKEQFSIHKAFFSTASKFFGARMKSSWDRTDEDGNNHVKLHHLKVSTFKDFLDWLYSGHKIRSELTKLEILELYSLADELIVPALKSSALTAYKRKVISVGESVCYGSLNSWDIRTIHAFALPPKDPLWTWSLELWTFCWDPSHSLEDFEGRPKDMEEFKGSLTAEFLYELLVRKAKIQKAGFRKSYAKFWKEWESEAGVVIS